MKNLFTLFCLFLSIQSLVYGQDYNKTIDIKNFQVTKILNNTIYYNFDIKGTYPQVDLYVYIDEVKPENIISTILWNRDRDDNLIFSDYTNKEMWSSFPATSFVNKNLDGRKFILVAKSFIPDISFEFEKTLEFYKEPAPIPVKKNDVKISNVKIRKIGTSFSQPPLYNSNSPSTPTIEWGYQYEALVTVQNIGEQDVNQQLTLLVRGYDTSNSNSSLFSFTSNFPSIPKGSSVNEFPVVFSQSNMSVQNPNSLEMLLHIDPSNSLNDKNLADNKHTLKYYFKKSNGLMSDLESSTIINIEVYNSAGNKIKSTFVNDLEKGVQEIKKSLPKGHYYFNIDGEKTQVKIQ
ncbi:hypothetical protein ACTS95_01355 [Empedobacter brevis]